MCQWLLLSCLMSRIISGTCFTFYILFMQKFVNSIEIFVNVHVEIYSEIFSYSSSDFVNFSVILDYCVSISKACDKQNFYTYNIRLLVRINWIFSPLSCRVVHNYGKKKIYHRIILLQYFIIIYNILFYKVKRISINVLFLTSRQ